MSSNTSRPCVSVSCSEEELLIFIRDNQHDLLVIREAISVLIERMNSNPNSKQPPAFPVLPKQLSFSTMAEFLYLREFLKEKEYLIDEHLSSKAVCSIFTHFKGGNKGGNLRKEMANMMGDCFSLLVGRGLVSLPSMVSFVLGLSTDVDPSICTSLIGRISARHPNAAWILQVFKGCVAGFNNGLNNDNGFNNGLNSGLKNSSKSNCATENIENKNHSIEVILEVFIVLLSSNRVGGDTINNQKLIKSCFVDLDFLTTLAMHSASPTLRMKGFKLFCTVVTTDASSPIRMSDSQLNTTTSATTEKIICHLDDLLLDASIPIRQNAKSSIKIWLETLFVPLYRQFVSFSLIDDDQSDVDIATVSDYNPPLKTAIEPTETMKSIKAMFSWSFDVLDRYPPSSPSPNQLNLALSILSQLIDSFDRRMLWWKKNHCSPTTIASICFFWYSILSEQKTLPLLLSNLTLHSLHSSIREDAIAILDRLSSLSLSSSLSPTILPITIPTFTLSSLIGETPKSPNEIDGLKKMKKFCVADFSLQTCSLSNNSHLLTALLLLDGGIDNGCFGGSSTVTSRPTTNTTTILSKEDQEIIRDIVMKRLPTISLSVQEREDSVVPMASGQTLDNNNNNNNSNNNNNDDDDDESTLVGDWRIVVEGLRLLKDMDLLIGSLLQIRHPGAFRMSADTLSQLTAEGMVKSGGAAASVSSVQSRINAILDILDCGFDGFDGEGIEITRRSAGIPMCVVAILEGLVPPRKNFYLSPSVFAVFNNVTGRLFESLSATSTTTTTTTTKSPQTHYLNILAQITKSQKLSTLTKQQNFINQSMSVTFRLFSSTDWNVRNSSLMLFVALLDRVFGVRHHCLQFSPLNLMDFRELLSLYPNLISLLEAEYVKAGGSGAFGGGGNFVETTTEIPKSSYLSSFALYPCLSILQRILFVGPGEGSAAAAGFYGKTEDFLFCIGLASSIKKVRRMSARLLGWSMSLEGVCHPSRRNGIIKRMQMELSISSNSNNKIDGLLYLKGLFFGFDGFAGFDGSSGVIGSGSKRCNDTSSLLLLINSRKAGDMESILLVMDKLWRCYCFGDCYDNNDDDDNNNNNDNDNDFTTTKTTILKSWIDLWGKGTYDISGQYRLALFKAGVRYVKVDPREEEDNNDALVIVLILLGLLDDDAEVRECAAAMLIDGSSVAQSIRAIFRHCRSVVQRHWDIISFIPMARECDLFQPHSEHPYTGPWREEPMNLFKDLRWLRTLL